MKNTLAIIPLIFILTACGPEKPKSPAEQSFIDANNKILSNKDKEAFGNTPEAESRAARFSKLLGSLQKSTFEGGSKVHALTGGQFLTYCQIAPTKIIFLCHVPDLKNYKDDARDALAQLAWTVGQQACAGLPTDDVTLVVGLRGALLYGPVWSGKLTGDPTKKAQGRSELEPYYDAFLQK
jgi:hypothetical protein